MSEVFRKIEKIREILAARKIDALRLRGVDWFYWATAGADPTVILTSETGIAEILITQRESIVLTNEIEHSRLRDEEVPPEFEIVSYPWTDTAGPEAYVLERSTSVMSDRPKAGEDLLPFEMHDLKRTLVPEEILRYRALGKDTAAAMREALALATPETTEQELAGLGACALWARGIHPTLTLVSGDERLEKYRHPIATGKILGERAMMVFCGRRKGLYANLTRHLYFRPMRDAESKSARDVMKIEAAAFRATRDGLSLGDVYARIESAYRDYGYPDEIRKHHQGGSTGYLSRELVAKPGIDWHCRANTAYAWNPSLPGTKIEDTLIIDGNGELEVLTYDPNWPIYAETDLPRPAAWIR